MTIHAFTSFSYSYLNRARVWAYSLRRFHPDWTIWAVITDKEPSGFLFNLSEQPFDNIITAEDLFPEETGDWLLGHDIVEACTMVKARALTYIMNQSDAKKVLYFDPDIAIFNSMQPMIELLDHFSIVVTPHQVDPEPFNSRQAIMDNEIGSLKWGIFNLGFLAVSVNKEAKRFASWWAERLQDWCYGRLDIGIFVDQKWCNLIPCFFDQVKVTRDPGYNVASWNLSQRNLTVDENGFLRVNGNLLRFFHFTKLGPIGDAMTKRYANDNLVVYELWAAYKKWIDINTDPRIPDGYWHYNDLKDGTPITKEMRLLYRKM